MTAGSELFLRYVVPDETHDGINRKVWAGTPWMQSVYVGRDRLEDPRERDMIDWCCERLGQEAWPLHGKPGRWHRGNAIIYGWCWWGFSDEADLRAFLEAFPTPEGVTRG